MLHKPAFDFFADMTDVVKKIDFLLSNKYLENENEEFHCSVVNSFAPALSHAQGHSFFRDGYELIYWPYWTGSPKTTTYTLQKTEH